MIVPNVRTPQLPMCHNSAVTGNPNLISCQMTALHSYTCAICQQIQRLRNFTCANDSTSQLQMCKMSADRLTPYLYFCHIPGLHGYTCSIYQHIQGPRIHNWARYQDSWVTHVLYISRYREPLVILVPNGSTRRLSIYHMSAHKMNP